MSDDLKFFMMKLESALHREHEHITDIATPSEVLKAVERAVATARDETLEKARKG